jgi:hypothetical protein
MPPQSQYDKVYSQLYYEPFPPEPFIFQHITSLSSGNHSMNVSNEDISKAFKAIRAAGHTMEIDQDLPV